MGRKPQGITAGRIEAAMREADNGRSAGSVLRDERTPGLSLAIGRSSARWRLDYKIPLPGGGWSTGRRLVLGDLSNMDLDAAREAARTAKEQVASGIDPVVARRARRSKNVEAAGSRTLQAAVERFAEERIDDWTEATRRAYRSDFKLINEELGEAPMALIERSALIALLDDFLAAQRKAGKAGVGRAIRIANLLSAIWRQLSIGSASRPGWGWSGIDPQAAARLPIVGRHRMASRSRVLSHT